LPIRMAVRHDVDVADRRDSGRTSADAEPGGDRGGLVHAPGVRVRVLGVEGTGAGPARGGPLRARSGSDGGCRGTPITPLAARRTMRIRVADFRSAELTAEAQSATARGGKGFPPRQWGDATRRESPARRARSMRAGKSSEQRSARRQDTTCPTRLYRWTRADPPLANVSTSSRPVMVTSPGNVVISAPCAQPSRRASAGGLPEISP
jgi:hypothetical protein